MGSLGYKIWVESWTNLSFGYVIKYAVQEMCTNLEIGLYIGILHLVAFVRVADEIYYSVKNEDLQFRKSLFLLEQFSTFSGATFSINNECYRSKNIAHFPCLYHFLYFK